MTGVQTCALPIFRFFGYLPKRIPEPSDTRFSDNSVTYGFNDFMTQCRQSPFVRRTASPQNRIRDDPPACVVTEADGATAKSVWKQKNKSSTIKINGTMSKEIFVAFATCLLYTSYHERIMRITRVIGHDRLTLSAYIDHVLTHHFNQCEDAIKSLYARNYNSVF